MKNVVLAVVAMCVSPWFCHAGIIYNGDFQNGSLAGWTTFTTSNGDLGYSAGTPQVTQFDVSGAGTPCGAAQFMVGQLSYAAGVYEGGGIYQTFNVTGGQYSISADFAAENISTHRNNSAGLATLSIDGSAVETLDFQQLNGGFSIAPGQIERSSFDTTLDLSAGSHQITIEFTRDFLNGASYGATPLEYVSGVQVLSVPEPSKVALAATALALLFYRKNKRKLASGQKT
jgi:hypothetical protein